MRGEGGDEGKRREETKGRDERRRRKRWELTYTKKIKLN